jgi:ribose transport system substrate-binding protein
VELRVKGFKEEMAKYANIKVLGPDYNDDDLNKATQQTAAVIEQNPDLVGVFGANVFSAQGAGNAVVNAGLSGKVQVVAYDATKDAVEMITKGDVSMALAQKPFDMGYLAVEFAVADAAGVTSLPKRLKTGFAIIDKANMADPNYARFIYAVPGK